MTASPTTETRITAAEYSKLPETTQPMQLIEGEIIMAPAPKHVHQKVAFRIGVVLDDLNIGEVVIAPSDLYLTDDTVLQPDVMLIKPDNPNCNLGDDDYWHGAPDLIVEILSPGTASLDRGRKFALYAQHGVREYWLVDPQAQFIEVFTPQNAQFIQHGLYVIDKTFQSPMLAVDVVVQKCFS